MYIITIRQWLHTIFTRPGTWLRMSLIFLLCALPLVSLGFAWGILLQLAYDEAESRKVKCFETVRKNFGPLGLRFFIMGLGDIALVFVLVLSALSLLDGGRSFVFRILSAFFVWTDLVFLVSGMYRYPMMAANPEKSFKDVLVNGFMLTLSHPGQTTLFVMVVLSVLLVTFFSGLFFPLLAPGAIALLSVFAYRNLINDIQNRMGRQTT
jgi:uncharacterized membrane protein YesL